ncbi:hypothetical protein HBB16_19980 [Pseudonocardia sp. MCCB 268]|nr:hypothetical protein [Pseudonocardia cytotoxica]
MRHAETRLGLASGRYWRSPASGRYGFAIAALTAADGRLGRVWQIPRGRLGRSVAGRHRTDHRRGRRERRWPPRTCTPPPRRAAGGSMPGRRSRIAGPAVGVPAEAGRDAPARRRPQRWCASAGSWSRSSGRCKARSRRAPTGSTEMLARGGGCPRRRRWRSLDEL